METTRLATIYVVDFYLNFFVRLNSYPKFYAPRTRKSEIVCWDDVRRGEFAQRMINVRIHAPPFSGEVRANQKGCTHLVGA